MQKAVDTNVLARALIADTGVQGRRATAVIRDCSVHIPETVLFETEWLLRSQLGVARGAVNRVLSNLLALSNVHLDDVAKVADALSAHKNGMDFADALHLFSARNCEQFLSLAVDSRNALKKLPIPFRLGSF